MLQCEAASICSGRRGWHPGCDRHSCTQEVFVVRDLHVLLLSFLALLFAVGVRLTACFRNWFHCGPHGCQRTYYAGGGGFPIGDIPVAERPGVDRFGKPVFVRPRLGQGAFRLAVTAAYSRACSVTGEHSLPALEAAHIRPYAEGGEHEVNNGILFRSDLHRLFDRGYVTVTPDFRLEVSNRLRLDYDNGRSYYPLHGSKVMVPQALHTFGRVVEMAQRKQISR
jgi:hypothetical protein